MTVTPGLTPIHVSVELNLTVFRQLVGGAVAMFRILPIFVVLAIALILYMGSGNASF